MIKMKVNLDKNSVCDECGRDWMHTAEMYTILLFGEKRNICRTCCDSVFRKTLSASCMYNGKVKGKEDKVRAANEAKYG